MAEIDKLCCNKVGEEACMGSSQPGALPGCNDLNSRYSISDGEGHGKRTHRMPSIRTLLICGIIVILISALIAVIVLLTLPRYKPLQPLPPVERNQTCMECKTLSGIVDKWAWKGISENKQTGQCCFNSEIGLFSTLKSYFDKRHSNSQLENDQLRSDVDVLHNLVVSHLLKHNSNDTSIPQYTHPDLQTLIDLINNVFHRKRSVLHITSVNTTTHGDEDPKVSWRSKIKQGHISLSNDSYSMTVMNTGLYFISTQVKFRASVFNNKSRDATVQFYLGTLRQGQLSHVDDYKKLCVFSERNTEHDAILHTMSRLERGDNLIIRFPRSQKMYLAAERGAHRISIFEL